MNLKEFVNKWDSCDRGTPNNVGPKKRPWTKGGASGQAVNIEEQKAADFSLHTICRGSVC